jgi:hypothetical protein
MTPGIPQPQIDPIQCPNMAEFTCPDCQEKVTARIQRPMIANSGTCSIVAFTHENLDVCPKCGAIFLFKIVGINPMMQLQTVWIKLPTKQSALVPGTENNLKSALEHARTLDEITGRKQ